MKVILKTLDGIEKVFDTSKKPEIKAIPCFRCGICCYLYQPKLEEDEAISIAKGLGISFEVFLERYAYEYPAKSRIYYLRRRYGACIFLRKRKGKASCQIHPFKPEACRNWEPNLSRPECLEGLKKIGEGILLIEKLYPSLEEKEQFCQVLRG